MTMLTMPNGTKVEQGGPEDKATWWTCGYCGFKGPHVGSNDKDEPACLASCGGKTKNPNAPRIPWFDLYCCPLLIDYVESFKSVDLSIGEGQISGYVTIDGKGVFITDGWNSLPMLPFNYCPFCGEKRNPE